MEIVYEGCLRDWQHNFNFDPSFGLNLDQLLESPVAKAPIDLTEFWQTTYALNQKIEAQPIIEAQWDKQGFNIKQLRYETWGGFMGGAWLLTPLGGEVHRGIVVGHGYGGRDEPNVDLGIKNTAYIFPVARGFHISPNYQNLNNNNAMQHVVHGLESKEQYIIRGCVAEIWTALTVLHKLVPETQEYSHYWGESFGGGLGALALPWDKRFGSAYLGIPTFGDQARRLKVNCEGSGKALYKRGRYHPELIEVLKYFDASSCAALIDKPLFMNVALFDPAVIPPCQFSVLNAVKAPTKVFIRSAGHFEYPQQEQENKLITHFLKEFFVR